MNHTYVQDERLWGLAFIVLVVLLVALAVACTVFSWSPLLAFAVGAVLGAAAMFAGLVYIMISWGA